MFKENMYQLPQDVVECLMRFLDYQRIACRDNETIIQLIITGFVILSGAKDMRTAPREILRSAQDDRLRSDRLRGDRLLTQLRKQTSIATCQTQREHPHSLCQG